MRSQSAWVCSKPGWTIPLGAVGPPEAPEPPLPAPVPLLEAPLAAAPALLLLPPELLPVPVLVPALPLALLSVPLLSPPSGVVAALHPARPTAPKPSTK